MSDYIDKAKRIVELLGLPETVDLTHVSDGASNPIYLNEYRICGGKPRIGNTTTDKPVRTVDLVNALIPSRKQSELMSALEESPNG